MKRKATKKTKKSSVLPQKNYVAFVLDSSGSMAMIQKEIVEGFNEQVRAIRQSAKGMPTKVSLVTFSSRPHPAKLWCEPVEKLQELERKEYVPDGCTALYDTVAEVIGRLEKQPDISDKNVSVLFLILSDGQENSSQEFNSEKLASLIKKCQATGRWTFTYLGANQDVMLSAQAMGIPVLNAMAFVSDRHGTQVATGQSVRATMNYMSQRRAGTRSVKNFYDPDAKIGTGKS